MAILEKIAASASLQAETNPTILITNRQHKNSLFSGTKPVFLDVPAGFGGECLVSDARKRCYGK